MKNLKFLLIALLALPLGFASCGDVIGTPEIDLSFIKEAKLKGEGDKMLIDFKVEDWYMAAIYSEEELSSTTTDLDRHERWEELEGGWYTIRRTGDKQIEVAVTENFGDYGRVLKLGIQSASKDSDIEIIILSQDITSNYQIKSIRFSASPIEESTFSQEVYNIPYGISNDFSSDLKISFPPLLNLQETSQFVSEDPEAFSWIKSDSIFEVEVPMKDRPSEATDVVTKREYINDITYVTTRYARSKTFETTVPVGKRVTAKIKEANYYKRIYDYTLIIFNKKSKDEKQIKGVWIEEVPFDCIMDVKIEDLQKGDL